MLHQFLQYYSRSRNWAGVYLTSDLKGCKFNEGWRVHFLLLRGLAQYQTNRVWRPIAPGRSGNFRGKSKTRNRLELDETEIALDIILIESYMKLVRWTLYIDSYNVMYLYTVVLRITMLIRIGLIWSGVAIKWYIIRSMNQACLDNSKRSSVIEYCFQLNLLVPALRQTLGSHRATGGALLTLDSDCEAHRSRRNKWYKPDKRAMFF